MKKFLIIIFLTIIFCLSANEPPQVSNVVVSQRQDGSFFVDIFYDLADADGDSMYVTISASDDEGESWNYLINSVQGDLGFNITSGCEKHIVWDFAADHPEVLNVPAMIKIIANDRNLSFDVEWCLIPAGSYTFGQNDEIQNLDYDYEMMKYEVTNCQYLLYLQHALADGDVWLQDGDVYGYYTGDEHYPPGNYIYYDLGTQIMYNYGRIAHNGSNFYIAVPNGYTTGDFDHHPVIEVSWFGANAFANKHGWRLPSEEEWEKAARGMTGYEYPWGDDLDVSRANFLSSGDPWETGTSPSGYFNGENDTEDSPSCYGCYDLCGNVYNWTTTWYNSTVLILRGGAWTSNSEYDDLRSWYRTVDFPDYTSMNDGFRCVRDCP